MLDWMMGVSKKKPGPLEALFGYLLGVAALIAERNTEPVPDVSMAFFTALFIGLILSGVSIVISELLRPKPDIENAKPGAKGDFRFPTADEGRPIPLLWGKAKLEGPNVVWWGDFRQVPIRENIKTGLWSKKRVTTGFQYFVGIDMALCRGGTYPVSFHRLFIGDKLVGGTPATSINEPEFLGGNEFGSGGIIADTEFFSGSTTQVASTYLVAQQTANTASGLRGTCHYVFKGGYIGNTTSIKKFSFELSRFPSPLLDDATSAGQNGNYGPGEHIVNADDSNPMEAIYEALLNKEWGLGKTSSDVNLANFSAVADILHTEGNGFGFQLERSIPVYDLFDLIQEQVDGVLFLDRLTGKYNFRLARQDYTVSLPVTSITGTNTYNVASNGTSVTTGETIYAAGFDDVNNNGRKTVASSTATTVVVSETLVNETPSGSIFGGARISELNGIDAGNKIEVREFSRQTWDGTTNQVRVGFSDRSREYFNTFARADSLGNKNNQGGTTVGSTINYPGCKNSTLANSLAARDLRFLSFPLAKATVLTNRDLWDANPGEVLRFTNEELGIIDLAMRIMRVDFGTVGGSMTIGLMQDMFSLEEGFFGVPPTPLWTLPVQGVLPIPIAEHAVFEAPKAIVDRDVLFPGQPDRVFVGARAQAGETAIIIFQRNSQPAISGTSAADGQNEGMFLIGKLTDALNIEDANPTTLVKITTTTFDSKTEILLRSESSTASEIGQQLANVILIDSEFIGFETAGGVTADQVDFGNCYRGLMDTVPADHAPTANVYLLYVSGGLNDSTIPPANIVEVRPRTVSRDAELTEGDSKLFTLTMDNRYRRPYPPYSMLLNTVAFAAAPSLDATITNPGGDTTGIAVVWNRRDFETTDEVVSLTADAATLDAGFQAKNDHESQLSATITDGDSLVIAINTPAFVNENAGVVARGDALWVLNGAIPSALALSILTRHTVSAVVYNARVSLAFTPAPTSAALGSLVNLGTVFATVSGTAGPVSKTFTAVSTNSHTLTVGTAITTVEFRLNNGAWTAIASLPGTGIAVSDELEFRHHDASGPPTNTVAVLDDGTDKAYVVFSTSTEFEGLVGYWNMNEVSTGVAQVDRAARFGGAPVFTDINTSSSEAGAKGLTTFGNAVKCTDGTNDATIESLQVPNADALRKNLMPVGTEEFTIACWMKFPVGGSTAKATQIIWSMNDFDSGSPFTNRSCYLFFGGGSDNFIFVFVENDGTIHSGTVKFSGGASGQEDKWIHCSMVVSSASGGTLTVYIKDGTSTPTPSYSAQTGLGTIQTTTEPVTVGSARRSNADSRDFSSEEVAIDEFRIYKGRALSEVEIDAIVAATQPLA